MFFGLHPVKFTRLPMFSYHKVSLLIRKFIPVLIGVVFLADIPCVAQDIFHRTYNPGRGEEVLNLTSIPLADGNFLSLDLLRDSLSDIANNILVTNYDKKGNVNFANRIFTGADSIVVLPATVSLERKFGGIYFSAVFVADEITHRIFGALNQFGDIRWLRKHVISNADTWIYGPAVFTVRDTFMHLATHHQVKDSLKLFLAKSDLNGNLQWSRIYEPKTDTLGSEAAAVQASQIQLTLDTTFLISGLVSDKQNKVPFLMETDSLANLVISARYLDSLNRISVSEGTEALKLSDSTFILAGTIDSLNGIFNPFGFVMKTDTSGQVVWSRKISLGAGSGTRISNVAIGLDSKLIISGTAIDSSSERPYTWMIKMNTNGTVNWQKKYPRIEVTEYHRGNMYGTMDSGIGLMSSTHESGKQVVHFIKTDINGSSSCAEDITGEIISDYTLYADTLYWTFADSGKFEVQTAERRAYSYKIPVITLNDQPTYCPNEPIAHVLDTPIPGAVYYKWSNGIEGDSASTITIYDTEQYSVTVTVDDGKQCYMMCDTMQLNRYTEPSVRIVESLGDFCTTGKIRLSRIYTAGAPNIIKRLWNTGETTDFIDINQTGIYSVTITDSCNELAEASINVQQLPRILTTAVINKDFSNICQQQTGLLTAVGNASLLTMTYLWNTGSDSQVITVSQPGTYTVTITDQCGNKATASVTIPLSEFRRVTLDGIEVDDTFCKDGKITITMSYSGDADIIWSNGEKNKTTIIVNQGGLYKVTVSDKQCNSNFREGSVFVDKLPRLASAQIDSINFSKNCDDIYYNIVVGITPVPGQSAELLKYLWNTGETTKDIKVTEFGTYTVTITDNDCKETILTAVVEAPALLKFAEVFFPETQDTLTQPYNASFGPIIDGDVCKESISEYEFLIFNRWGQKVFESNDIDLEWKGRREDDTTKKDPTEVYVWRVRYKAFGLEFTNSGDVTLVRFLSR